MISLLVAVAIGSAQPSDEAQRLGLFLAEQGTLASLLPLQKKKETDDLLKENPDLSDVERRQLRETADDVFKKLYDKLMKVTGDAYAHKLSLADLRSLSQFYHLPVAARYRAATPAVILQTVQSIGSMDFKGDVRAAFCSKTKKLCSDK